MVTTLLILHVLLSVALIGAITHQALSAWRKPATRPAASFIGKARGVSAVSYTDAIVVLYVLTAILGFIIYAPYRLDIRPVLEDLDLRSANGLFETKEHFIAIGLVMLPAYWFYWRQPLSPEHANARKYVTAILAFFVWYGFLVGHLLNNIKGYGV